MHVNAGRVRAVEQYVDAGKERLISPEAGLSQTAVVTEPGTSVISEVKSRPFRGRF